MDWVATALRQSHDDEKHHHDEAIARLQAEYTRLQNRIDATLLDRHAVEWRAEQARVREATAQPEAANQTHFNEGGYRTRVKSWMVKQRSDRFRLMRRVLLLLLVIASGATLLGACHEAAQSQIVAPETTKPFEGEGLTVRHLPTDNPAPDAGFPYLCPYRTEVKNVSNVPIRITTFEGHSFDRGGWRAGNILKRVLTTDDFVWWYDNGDPVTKDGVLAPGQIAVCDPNWHGSSDGVFGRSKWTYMGVDPSGHTYFAEAEVPDEICARYPK